MYSYRVTLRLHGIKHTFVVKADNVAQAMRIAKSQLIKQISDIDVVMCC